MASFSSSVTSIVTPGAVSKVYILASARLKMVLAAVRGSEVGGTPQALTVATARAVRRALVTFILTSFSSLRGFPEKPQNLM